MSMCLITGQEDVKSDNNFIYHFISMKLAKMGKYTKYWDNVSTGKMEMYTLPVVV